jgi:hypothetical protein
MKRFAACLVVLGLSATAALAQTPTSFADVDTDANGELSFAELGLVWPDLTPEEFGGADLDLSGGLSAGELNTLQPATAPVAPGPAPTMN